MEPAHLTEAEIHEYLDHRLTPAAIIRLHDHLAECTFCTDAMGAGLRASGRTEALPILLGEIARPGFHADENDLIQLVEEKLAAEERRRVEAHVEACTACGHTVQDLRGFREELLRTSRPRRSFSPVWMLAAAAGVAIALLTVPRIVHPHPTRSATAYLVSLEDTAGLVGVTASGELSGLKAPSLEESLVKQALRSGVLPRGPGALTDNSKHVLRGGSVVGPAFEPQYPAGRRVVSDRPEFHWPALDGATSYEVKVFDAGYREAARSGRISSNRWQPENPLTRGKTYVWQVTAIRARERITAPAPPQPEARFLILEQHAAAGIEQARSGGAPSHLLLAVLYSREGLREEAFAEMDKLAQMNPASSLVASLRRSLASLPK